MRSSPSRDSPAFSGSAASSRSIRSDAAVTAAPSGDGVHPPARSARPLGPPTAGPVTPAPGIIRPTPRTEPHPMPTKPHKPAFDLAVYLAVRAAVGLIQALPPAWAFRLAEVLAWVAYTVDKRHREVAADNLRHAFPELAADPGRVDSLVRATYRHFLRITVEIALLPRKLRPSTRRKYVTMAP